MCLWQLWWQPGSTRTHTHAYNSPACLRSRFISLRLPPTLIIWVLRSLQGSYAPHALPNNPLVATSPHIVCNLSHCSVHVHTTIFDSLSLSLSLSTYVLHSRSRRCNLCNSTRLYIVRSFFLFFFFHSLLFCFARCYTDPIRRPARRIDSSGRELWGQVSREIQGGVLYITLMPRSSLKRMASVSSSFCLFIYICWKDARINYRAPLLFLRLPFVRLARGKCRGSGWLTRARSWTSLSNGEKICRQIWMDLFKVLTVFFIIDSPRIYFKCV